LTVAVSHRAVGLGAGHRATIDRVAHCPRRADVTIYRRSARATTGVCYWCGTQSPHYRKEKHARHCTHHRFGYRQHRTCRCYSEKANPTKSLGKRTGNPRCPYGYAACLKYLMQKKGVSGGETLQTLAHIIANDELAAARDGRMGVGGLRRFGFYASIIIALLGSYIFAPTAGAAACPTGRITCTQWCAKYRPKPSDNCMSGARGSCDRIGFNHCVDDGPPRLITCEGWCYKYRAGSESCLRTDPRSCLKHYGSLKHLIVDGPPR